jgi:hypothetical protein
VTGTHGTGHPVQATAPGTPPLISSRMLVFPFSLLPILYGFARLPYSPYLHGKAFAQAGLMVVSLGGGMHHRAKELGGSRGDGSRLGLAC